MQIEAFYDKGTATVSYVVTDEATQRCAIIDPVLDYDPQSGTLSSSPADRLIDYVEQKGLKVEWLLETHIHADHLTASGYLQERLGGKIGVSDKIIEVLNYWVPIFDTEADTPLDGSQFDHLFYDGETFDLGTLTVKVMHTPGHTPSCACYLVEDTIFVGDTLFMPEGGTARADFPGGDAEELYRSIHKIFALSEKTRIFVCHNYPQEGQPPLWETTVGDQKTKNILINESVTESQYVEKRKARDCTLATPRLLYPSIQVNLRAGRLLNRENQREYIKIPVTKWRAG